MSPSAPLCLSTPLCPNLTFNAEMCPRTLQCTNIFQMYPPICHYAPPVPPNVPICLLSNQYIAMCPSLSSSVSLFLPCPFRYALISQYAYSLIGSPPQPVQSCCVYFSRSSPEVSHALWELMKKLTRMCQQKTLCLISNYVHTFPAIFMGNH